MVDAPVCENWACFMDQLQNFFRARGEELKIPIFNRQEINLEKLWRLVRAQGGSEEVCRDKKWAHVGRCFNPPPSMTNLSFHIKKIYEKCLLQYEKDLYPSEAMSKENEQPSPSHHVSNPDAFFNDPVHVPRKRRSTTGRRRSKKLRKFEMRTEASVNDDSSEQTPSWLRGYCENNEVCESEGTPESQITTPDWLAGRESDDGHTYEAVKGIAYGSDEIAAAAALSEMCQMNRSKGGDGPSGELTHAYSQPPRHQGCADACTSATRTSLQPSDALGAFHATGHTGIDRRHPQVFNFVAGESQSSQVIKKEPMVVGNYFSSIIQVAPPSTNFTPPAPVIVSTPTDPALAIQMKEFYEARIAALKSQHLQEITELRRLAAHNKQQLVEKQARLRDTEASAEEARRCFQTLLDMVRSKREIVRI